MTTQTPCQSRNMFYFNGLELLLAGEGGRGVTPALQLAGRAGADIAQPRGRSRAAGVYRRCYTRAGGRYSRRRAGRFPHRPPPGLGCRGAAPARATDPRDARSAATGLGGPDIHPRPRPGTGAGLARLPAAAGRLDRAAEARAGRHPELAAGPGAAAVRRVPGLPRVRAAEDPPPSAAAP